MNARSAAVSSEDDSRSFAPLIRTAGQETVGEFAPIA
jgi:hypothetical protein